MRLVDRRGYTLVELIIVCLVVGVMASFAVPQYLRSVENGKFDDAAGLINQIGTTNKMFALDHGGNYVNGTFSGPNCGCATMDCHARLAPYGAVAPDYNPTMAVADPCVLVCCNYLADQNWDGKPYAFSSCDPISGNGGVYCANQRISAGWRINTTVSPYSNWSAYMQVNGQIISNMGAPVATY